MSKIYEALLRAELERALATGETLPAAANGEPTGDGILASLSQTPGPSLVVPRPVVDGGGFVARENIFPFAGEMGGELPSQDARELAGPGVMPADPFVIPAYAWKPSLKQLPALEERGSAVEQFRSLRSRMHEFRDLNPLKSVVVSSGLPQEGKSFVAANLAISFARHKSSRVLLIDGDMRRSSLHTMLGCPSEPGLTEYLSGKCTLLEVMQRAKPREDGLPLPRGIASLTFIAGGADADNAADLSGNDRFGEMIRAVSPVFDWIVVDTPPVNLVADGVNLARACDGTLLITRGGVTRYESAQRALSELKANNVLGVVLNAVEKPPVTGGYYGYDNYDSKKE